MEVFAGYPLFFLGPILHQETLVFPNLMYSTQLNSRTERFVLKSTHRNQVTSWVQHLRFSKLVFTTNQNVPFKLCLDHPSRSNLVFTTNQNVPFKLCLDHPSRA
jgi:hypothetical protein